MPPVTDPASLTKNVVHDTVLLSIPTSRRALKNKERAADSALRHSYAPGLAESPPESFPWESIHFDPEVQDMSSHDQQVAAEHALLPPEAHPPALVESDDDDDEPDMIVRLRRPRRRHAPSSESPDNQPDREAPSAEPDSRGRGAANEEPAPAEGEPAPAPRSGSEAPADGPPRERRRRARPARPARRVVDHPAFITDDRTRWPELHSLGPIDQEGQHCKGCGAAHWFEERTQAAQKKGRGRLVTFNECCKHGTVRLPPVSDPFPPELKALFTGEGSTFHDIGVTPALRNMFCDHTRTINNQLAFACITNTNQDKKINNSRPGHVVPWVYRIHGQMYRQIAPAEPRQEAQTARYSQLYFRDPADSVEAYRRAFDTNETLQSIVTNTHFWLRDHNPFARHYKTLREVVDHARQNGEEMPLYSIEFNNHKDLDHRVYNVPPVAVTEVAAILLGERTKWDRERTLTVTNRFVHGHENFSVINCTVPQGDALCYPLLFPRGDLSWHYKMETWDGPPPPPEPPAPARRRQQAAASRRQRSFIDDEARNEFSESESSSSSESDQGEYGQARQRRRQKPAKQWEKAKKLTMLDFFAYRLHWRKEGVHSNNKFDPLFYAKRLFQQYAVDAFSKVEENTLNYLRKPETQKNLRAEHYETLKKYVAERANDRNLKPGTPVVLPSTFSGSSRHMAQEYKDAMAIVRKKGKHGIDYFLTMTANPDWEEVVASLPRDANGTLLQKAIDRPDIVARVFKLKLDAMLKDVFESKIFGEIAGYAWTLEYQV